MEQQLILNGTIYGNLRRTLKKHLLSSKSVFQINELALKYFGIYDDAGELIGYQCPYSGKKITNTKKIILEHMIPVNSGGGTTLFNCIPTSEIVNKLNEKGSKHLIEWWIGSKYWDNDAPKRLEKLVQYIFESYEITFNQNEMKYDDIDVEELDDVDYDYGVDDEADLTKTQEDEQQVESTSLISYYGFINDILNELKNYTDISSYQFRLQNLVGKNFFGNIDRQTKIQEFLKEFIKDRFEFEDRTELRFVLNVDIESLSKSLENYSDGDMFLELERRINNIERILDDNNLSLYSFFEDINVLNYLDKSAEELTNEDISNLVNDINICARDKFNIFINFVLEHNGLLPMKGSKDEKEAGLGNYRTTIQRFDKKRNVMGALLSEEQLKYLHDSKYEKLREIYKTILYKTVEARVETGNNDIKIDYEDTDMVVKIQEYLNKRKGTTIEERIELEKEYRDYIVIDSQFYEFIGFVLEHNGLLPMRESKDEKEVRLAMYRTTIQQFDKGRNVMGALLSGEQLKYLHDSEYEGLREIYKTVLYKTVEARVETGNNDIKIDYEDTDMVVKIQEYLNKRKGTTIEERIELEKEYRDYIVIDSQFNEFIGFVLEHNGLLPMNESKDEKEVRLAKYRTAIQHFDKKRNVMKTLLFEEQLKYLHDSKYEELREIYKTILYKTVEARVETGNNDIKTDYEDTDMVVKIQEYLNKRKGTTIEERIELEKEYRDYIVIDSQFNEFIGFVLEHNGLLPTQRSKDEKEARLAIYRTAIQRFDKKRNAMVTSLSEEQLKYLHDSKHEKLREIYKTILYKTVEARVETGNNDIKIDYEDTDMVVKIQEYLNKRKGATIEEQIELEKEYRDYIVIDSQFNEFIGFVLEHNGLLPMRKSKDEKEARLAIYRTAIQSFDKKRNVMATLLSEEQLKYLHDSEYEELREIYDNIMRKAYENGYSEYIEFDKKIRKENSEIEQTDDSIMRGRVA